MNLSDFATAKTGTVVRISGIKGLSHAFVPNPLPPAWKWSESLWPLLVEARTALGTLDGTGRHLPNAEIVLRPLQSREAQKSSSLEGTFTDPTQQALFQIDPRYPDSAADPANAYREVFNYGRALRMTRAQPDALPISLRLIRDLHSQLMDGVRSSDRTPGEFRRTQNQIGLPPRFVPPPPDKLPAVLNSFENYLHAPSRFDPLVNAFLVHYQFEAIHPFADGNGRVGRLLLAVLIAEWCKLSDQWLYMSAYFDAHKDEYIDRLYQISTEGRWREWIEFCLRGVVSQAADTQERCDKLLALRRNYRERLRSLGGSLRLAAIVDDLFMVPVTSVANVARQRKVTYPTARSDLRKLDLAGIVSQLPEARTISYYSKDILEIAHRD